MDLKWAGRPGDHSPRFEIDHAYSDPLRFSLCYRQDADDPFLFRLFVYHAHKGYKHLGGFDTPEAARAFASSAECEQVIQALERRYER